MVDVVVGGTGGGAGTVVVVVVGGTVDVVVGGAVVVVVGGTVVVDATGGNDSVVVAAAAGALRASTPAEPATPHTAEGNSTMTALKSIVNVALGADRRVPDTACTRAVYVPVRGARLRIAPFSTSWVMFPVAAVVLIGITMSADPDLVRVRR